MLVVIALGTRAVLRRQEAATVEARRANVRVAAQALAPVAAEHRIVIGHGGGPQAGLLSSQAAVAEVAAAYPLDLLRAQGEGMVGYLIEQELGNLLPFGRPFATVMTMVEVDPSDPAFQAPSAFVGPPYDEAAAERLAAEKGWTFKEDGPAWRRVVASPEPKRIFELRPIRWLVERNTIVIAAGGGGIPTMFKPGADRQITGADCVIDKDLAMSLLARELDADFFVMLTDVDAVYANWGQPSQTAIRRASPDLMTSFNFSTRSIGPKVDAACRFTSVTGKPAAIGALEDLSRILRGEAGTLISVQQAGIDYAPRAATTGS